MMTERQVLECMLQITAKEYHNTEDEWWFNLGVTIAKKLGRRKDVSVQKKTDQI